MKRLPLISILAALIMAVATALPGIGQRSAPTSTVRLSMDSVYVVMGRLTPLRVELTTHGSPQGVLMWPGDTLTEGVEIAGRTDADTTQAQGERVVVTRVLMLQSFDSGDYIIPAVRYIDGHDTVLSNTLALKVLPTPVDTLSTIHDYAPEATLKAHFWDWVPGWIADYWGWWLALVIVVTGSVVAYIVYRKKMAGRPVIKLRPAPKPIPPYELALRELNTLREEHLCESGREKEFYTRLTDILRRYIDARFNINAMEMTSQQILRALRRNPEARISEQHMQHILEIADFVKFAKLRPFSDDNTKAFNDAVAFVNDTRPAPAAQADAAQPSTNSK